MAYWVSGFAEIITAIEVSGWVWLLGSCIVVTLGGTEGFVATIT